MPYTSIRRHLFLHRCQDDPILSGCTKSYCLSHVRLAALQRGDTSHAKPVKYGLAGLKLYPCIVRARKVRLVRASRLVESLAASACPQCSAAMISSSALQKVGRLTQGSGGRVA